MLIYDCRGHGKSGKPSGPYTVEGFADDLADLLDHVGWDSALAAGASMGGCVSLAFAASYPKRARALGLFDTTAWYGADAPKQWEERAQKALSAGLGSMVEFQTTRWFGDAFRARHPEIVRQCVEVFLRNDLPSYAASCRMLGACDLRAKLPGMKLPAAVLVGEEDYAAPPAMAEALHRGICRIVLRGDQGRASPHALGSAGSGCGRAVPPARSGRRAMMPFDLVEPGSLGEALALLDPGDPSVRPLAGGTALMLMMKSGLFRPKRLVSLRAAGERLSRVKTGTDGGLRIGAMVRLSTLERAPEIHRGFRVIARTLRTLANVRVRNVATLGGHLAHADPHADLPPVLIALGASIVAAGPSGERIIPAEQFATGIYETALKGDELIVEVTLPPPGNWRAAYAKCTTRSADDWPALGVAVAVEAAGTAVKEARVVIGAAVERPVRLKSAEDLLRGKSLDDRADAAGGRGRGGRGRCRGRYPRLGRLQEAAGENPCRARVAGGLAGRGARP